MDISVVFDGLLALIAFFWVVLPAGVLLAAVLVSRRAPAPRPSPAGPERTSRPD